MQRLHRAFYQDALGCLVYFANGCAPNLFKIRGCLRFLLKAYCQYNAREEWCTKILRDCMTGDRSLFSRSFVLRSNWIESHYYYDCSIFQYYSTHLPRYRETNTRRCAWNRRIRSPSAFDEQYLVTLLLPLSKVHQISVMKISL